MKEILPTVKIKRTTTKRNKKTGSGRKGGSSLLPGPVLTLKLKSGPCAFTYCGLLWQPFDVHTRYPLISEQNSHGKVFPAPRSPGLLVPVFYPSEKAKVLVR